MYKGQKPCNNIPVAPVTVNKCDICLQVFNTSHDLHIHKTVDS